MPDRTAEKPAAASSPALAVKAQPFHYARPNGEAPNISARPNGGESGATHSSSSDPIAEKAYQKGLVDGKSAARGEFEKALAELRGQITEAVHHFSKDRADYFTRVETEVVRLSLSIARKILHRESQLDPFVLTGVVHVALQKLNSETKITIRAHHDEVRIWKDYFRQSEDIFPAVTVTADPSLSLGHVLLETEFGTTEISLDTQLKEIEQGFFDLLEQRPKALP